MGSYDPKLTLDEANQLHVICPIFHAETPIAACFKLRELVWCGERPPQRQGCQACMRASKCPINNILWDMIRKPDTDPYASRTKKVVQFADHDLDRIARVRVPESIMNLFDLSDKEKIMIERANAAAGSGLIKKVRRNTTVEIEREVEPADLSAAQTGDMSAAINAVIEKESNNG